MIAYIIHCQNLTKSTILKMLNVTDSLLLIGLAHWIVWTILAVNKIELEEKDKTYGIGLIGMVIAVGVLIFKMF